MTTKPDEESKAFAKIQIINNSKSHILFKVSANTNYPIFSYSSPTNKQANIGLIVQVKTTQIKNYMVRPNADMIKPQGKVTVKIQTQQIVNAVSTLTFCLIGMMY